MINNFDPRFEKSDGLETNYLKILYYDLSKNYEETYKSYQYARFCTIANGSKQVTINNGTEFTYKSSDFIVLPPHSQVQMKITEPTTAIVYEISGQLIERVVSRLENIQDQTVAQNSQVISKIKYEGFTKSHVDRINHYCMSNDPNKEYLIDLCAQELAYSLVKQVNLNWLCNEKVDPVQYTIQYLKEHIYDKSDTIGEIAFKLNMSPSNLINQFKKATQLTPKVYHNRLKLQQALNDLNALSVSEVCYNLGFESISYFIKLFKETYGITPKQYVLSQRKNLSEFQ